MMLFISRLWIPCVVILVNSSKFVLFEMCYALFQFFADASLPFPFDLVTKANKILREGDVVTRSTVQIEAYDGRMSRTCTQCLHPGPSRASLVI